MFIAGLLTDQGLSHQALLAKQNAVQEPSAAAFLPHTALGFVATGICSKDKLGWGGGILVTGDLSIHPRPPHLFFQASLSVHFC